ncbi:TlpA disulfide reductase family protein [Dyella sp. A6]|uniref:TlpA family protein disulfide reductase n=1 Tax=Dyella aluminiiresistens TaxID=3069105 RepID=UPI002E777531|nr:TlpA disulfide reductase family protein [Dyella sp. A6]
MKWYKASALAVFAFFAAAPSFAAMPLHPSLKVTTLKGANWSLAAQRGHWVIVNFWATWCVPCIKEMPDISSFVTSHPAVRAIGLAYDDSPLAKIRTFVAKHPVSYPVAQVTLDKSPKDFDPPLGLPTTYLIAPDGTVAKRFIGPVDGHILEAAIKASR